jgi:hypothetical protein
MSGPAFALIFYRGGFELPAPSGFDSFDPLTLMAPPVLTPTATLL